MSIADTSALKDKRIVNTRAEHQAGELNTILATKGAQVVPFPCIAIRPPEDTTALDDALRALESFDWLLLTSANTVYALQERLEALAIAPDWNAIRVAAVGSATAQAFEDTFHTQVDLIPDEAYAEKLAESLYLQANMRVLLPQSALASPELVQRLIEKTAFVAAVTAYENCVGTGGDDVETLLLNNSIHALTFTSSSTVENFITRIGHNQNAIHNALALPVACIGTKTEATATACGFQTIITPENPSLEALVKGLETYFS